MASVIVRSKHNIGFMKKILTYSLILVILALVGAFFFVFYPRTPIIAGFAAHSVCSCHFSAGRDQVSIEQNDNDIDIISRAKNIIDEKEKSVTSTIFGLRKRKAIYRKGYGCVLMGLDGTMPAVFEHEPPSAVLNDTLVWPYGKKENVVINPKVQEIVAQAFDQAGENVKKSRAVVVVHNGQIIGEQYAPGFDKDTPLLGWSMTKSIVNALYGIQVQQGKVDINQPVKIPEWTDNRKAVTFNSLLQMNSGLEWTEDYASISDATKMLFEAADVSSVQLHKPLEFAVGEHWEYSSGTSNLLSGLLRKQFETTQAYLDFPYEALFNKLGMASMVLETDLVGNYIASSYSFATPRDWAKFGLLYLNDGVWGDERILPKGWVKYTTTPAQGSEGDYGSQFWLNIGKEYPKSPKDMFYCDGYQGQYVYILPSQNLVIVRMGLLGYPDFAADELVSGVVSVLE